MLLALVPRQRKNRGLTCESGQGGRKRFDSCPAREEKRVLGDF